MNLNMKFPLGSRVRSVFSSNDIGTIIAYKKSGNETFASVALDDKNLGYKVCQNLIDEWKNFGYTVYDKCFDFIGKWEYWFSVEKLELLNKEVIVKIVDKPCQICNRINNFSSKKCWWCENIP